MTQSKSFYRKLVYLALIGVLLFPLARLGAPATLRDSGGTLAQLREENDLGQAQIGQIDPASEAMRLATLGLRGIATSLLWSKANNYKKTEDWTSFRATLYQLAKLQPYFISVWKYQAWNLSYNVSVELDDVRDRYYYVKRGIEFLKEGNLYNRDNPALLSDLGWFLGNKIGRADEKKEYRRLFKLDDDYHDPATEPADRDNWQRSRYWYEQAVEAVDGKGQSLGNKNPTTFYLAPAKSQINYSEARQEDGFFGARAREEWEEAEKMWVAYGNRDLRSSRGFLIRLEDLDRYEGEAKELEDRLEALDPGLRIRMEEEAKASLTDEQRQAWQSRNDPGSDVFSVGDVGALLEITHEEVADRIAKDDPSKAAEAQQIANQLRNVLSRGALISINRDVSNYEYWKTRCQFEQTLESSEAHELAAQARKAMESGDPFTARDRYEESFRLWNLALDKFPELPDDSVTGSDIMEVIYDYADTLVQLDQSLGDEQIANDFPLWRIIEANDSERRFSAELAKYHDSQADSATGSEGPASLVDIASGLGADATEADATEADATEADTTEADTTEADATEADTTEADTTEADTTEADTTEADTTEADTTEADTTEADTTEADTTEADTTEADTTEADTTEADTTEADTTEAELVESNVSDTDVEQIEIDANSDSAE